MVYYRRMMAIKTKTKNTTSSIQMKLIKKIMMMNKKVTQSTRFI